MQTNLERGRSAIMILIYQVVIFSIVFLSGGNKLITGLVCLWTFTHVFWLPLAILQFTVIGIAYFLGRGARALFK